MDKGTDLTSLAVKGRGFDEKIRPTLDLLDKVRSHLADVDLVDTHFIPSLAVIGKQSSGKSSVLERLACCPLPRGDGMVTMNPLIMELRYSESESCEIGLSTDKMKSVSIEEVSTHIRRFAQVIREGNNSGYDFSSQPIYLRIQKPTLRDLTLIDLPGEYDVNKDTHLADERIRNTVKALYEEFCLSPKCTIICVLPATEDTVNHVARGWSREWDPSGQRTIGVLTKCDLVQKEKSLRERIEGRGVNSTGLQHLVAVCNPLQETDDVRIEGVEERFLKIQSEEEMFFKTKFGSFYENLAEKCGIEALVDTLVVIQARSFDGVIPEVLSSIAAEKLKLEDDLRQCPEEVTSATHASIKTISYCYSVLQTFREKAEYNPRFATLFDAYSKNVFNLSAGVLTNTKHLSLRSKFQDVRGETLPSITIKKLMVTEVLDMIGTWVEPSKDLLHDMHTLVIDIFDIILKNSKENSKILRWVQRQLELFFSNKKSECLAILTDILDKEKYIYTLNRYYEATVAKLQSSENLKNLLAHIVDVQENNDKVDLENADEKIPTENLYRRLEIQSYSPEAVAIVKLQTEIYSYIKVARNRWVDDVCLFFRVKFVNSLMEQGSNYFREKV